MVVTSAHCFAAVEALCTKPPSDWTIWSKKQAGPTKTCSEDEYAEGYNGQKQTPSPQPPGATEEQLQWKTPRDGRTGQEQELFDVTGTLGTSQPDVPSPLLLFHLRAETTSCPLVKDPFNSSNFSKYNKNIYSISIIYSSSFPGLAQLFSMLDEMISMLTLQ